MIFRQIEKILNISNDDCINEGVNSKYEYQELWKSINSTPGTRWLDNPHVWVITFEVLA